MICSFNQGNGAPCTIKRVGGEMREAPPVQLPKAKQDAVRARVSRARQVIGDHMPWIVQMMHEHMDKVVGAAKHEIQAEIGRRLAGAGLQLDGDVAGDVGVVALLPTKDE
jgi:hypothetical protein